MFDRQLKKMFVEAARALEGGGAVVLATVVDSDGSAPRKSGSVMAVFADGASAGTVGGGALEYEVQRVAREILDKRTSDTVEYSLAANELGDVCMVCGGGVTVHYQYLAPSERNRMLFRMLADAADKDGNSWVIYRISGDGATETTFCDGGALHYAELTTFAEIEPLLGRVCTLTDGEPRYYALPLSTAGRALIFGGGHVAQEVVPALSRVDFRCVVFDDREEFTRPELFPDAGTVILGDFNRVSEKLTVEHADYIVVLTRGHKADFEVLRQVLPLGAAYTGCIGSRRKTEIIKRRLRESGVSDGDIARMHSPIGVAIGAETPAEIAVSIAAEMILHRARG
ncbi:MAG: XdhC family protein [Oscillospiraceae bacterium]|jgi:xanthine dehydrogenase accessory factor|nr:XdhC family protein [Oscillospiraceae bacterium]